MGRISGYLCGDTSIATLVDDLYRVFFVVVISLLEISAVVDQVWVSETCVATYPL